ncbi:MAG TPA: hypothetical protein VMN60_14540 [Longimicrobiales bacterium]|nr:hypothetical protein [Longimicrobiales bacterium]
MRDSVRPPTDAGKPARADRLAVAFIVLLAIGAFSPWWAAGRLLAPLDILHETFAPWNEGDVAVDVHNHFTSDAVTQYLGYRAFAERSYAQDGKVGWSDLTHGGRPEYANTMALYDDWTMQLHRVFDFWTAWHVGLLLQLLIAASGMYVLLRSQQILPIIAVAGAIAFAASTPIVHTLYHRWQLGAFAWMPWTVWAMLQQLRGRRWAWFAVPPLLALALLGGSLQTAAFVLLTVGGVWLGCMLELAGRRARLRWTLHTILWCGLGAALAAYALVPALLTWLDGVALHGARNAPGYAHGWQQPLRALLFIPLQAVPTLLGSPRSMDLAKLFHVDLTNIAFFGFIPAVVALRSTVWARTPAPARLLILIGLLVPLTPLVGALYHRVQIVFVFGGVWAFAHYWQHSDRVPERLWRVLLGVLIALTVCWLGASIAVALMQDRVEALLQAHVASVLASGGGGQLGGFSEWLHARAARLAAELSIWHPRQLAALAGAALGMAAVWLRTRAGLHTATALLLCALLLELGAAAASFVTYADARRYPLQPARADIAALKSVVGGGRVYVASSHAGPALFFPSNTLPLYGIATIQQYETVDVPGMWHAAGYRDDARTLGRMAVTHAVAVPGTVAPAGWRVIAAGAHFDVWRNVLALPRYAAIPRSWDLNAYLDDVQAGRRTAPDVHVDSATFSHRVLRVPAGTGSVRVAENWAEGWQYRVAGGAWQRSRAGADRSMVLPLAASEAASRVEMWYRPQRRQLGRAISLCALLLLVPAGMLVRRRHEFEAMRD